MPSLLSYFRDSFAELSLVTWPKQEQLVHDTILCIIAIFIAAAILGFVDFSFMNAYEWFLTLAP